MNGFLVGEPDFAIGYAALLSYQHTKTIDNPLTIFEKSNQVVARARIVVRAVIHFYFSTYEAGLNRYQITRHQITFFLLSHHIPSN